MASQPPGHDPATLTNSPQHPCLILVLGHTPPVPAPLSIPPTPVPGTYFSPLVFSCRRSFRPPLVHHQALGTYGRSMTPSQSISAHTPAASQPLPLPFPSSFPPFTTILAFANQIQQSDTASTRPKTPFTSQVSTVAFVGWSPDTRTSPGNTLRRSTKTSRHPA